MFNVAIHVHHLVFQQYVVTLSHAEHQQFSENLRSTQAMLLPSEKKKKGLCLRWKITASVTSCYLQINM